MVGFVQACMETDMNEKNKSEMENQIALFNKYDPSREFEYGQLNPAAPEQTKEFQFMIGKYNCDDSLLVNGKWKHSKATWESAYILNGYGIKDTYRNDTYAGTSIRFYNTKKDKWDVYFFGMPGEHTGLWEGEKVDGKMIMRQKRKGPKGENLESRLTFYQITENSFFWKGELWNLDDETATVNWKIKAIKNK